MEINFCLMVHINYFCMYERERERERERGERERERERVSLISLR